MRGVGKRAPVAWRTMFGKVVLLAALLAFAKPAQADQLRQVILVFRHGERTPASTYVKDIYRNEDFFPYGWGQLTNTGKMNQYKQGQWLRERYRDFLGEILTPTLIQASSTYPPRAKMSLSLMLAGLLPPSGPQIWNKNLAWQPFPWVSSGDEVDKLLLATNCPRIQEAMEEVEKSQETVNYNREHEELYRYLSFNTGEKVWGPADVFDWYGTLLAEKEYGLELPEWTRSVFPEKMAEVTKKHFILASQTNELKRLTGGRLLKKVIETCRSKIDTQKDHPKMIVYAGHDSTVVNLLRALGVWEEQVPAYSIMAMFELFGPEKGGSGDWSMKVLLRNSTQSSSEPYELAIPGCSVKCPFRDFVHLTSSMIPQDLETECKTKEADFQPERPPSGP